ncbi:YdeI/OmpD-associated family protein [Methanobacterium sp.]|uniref:YdeI/OmpD-associated family protein n=1 Tax=Methanobacterium sp. TaxID=2164 RepID=UPI002AB9A96C|nr:YdeI/OmpD-associated family protein [Methanobacterium sp.]MDY9924034.1 YdeI/OmpD-associated family protein [Methanobacterium sp.]
MSKSLRDQFQRFYARNREEWRWWLTEHHETSPGVWLIYYKKNSEKTGISYDDAVEEALSFGWIDSKVNTLDEERYMQVFTPRKPGSNWSKLNKQRIEKLMKKGLMNPRGLEKVEAAKKDGSWNFMDDIEDLVVPEDLKNALNKDKIAFDNFEAFSGSVKKQVLYWIASAKKDETRIKRIEKTLESIKKGETPF